MRGVNEVTLMGNVGKDPSVREVEGRGESIATFPLATTEFYRDRNGEKKEITEWHNIVAWSELAESVRKSELKKSDTVYIKGKLKTRKYTDKEGKDRKETEVIVDTFIIVKRYTAKETTTEASAEHTHA